MNKAAIGRSVVIYWTLARPKSYWSGCKTSVTFVRFVRALCHG